MRMNLGGGTFVGQVGNGQQDHAFWRRPDEITQPFPVYTLTPSAPGGNDGLLGQRTQVAPAASPLHACMHALPPGPHHTPCAGSDVTASMAAALAATSVALQDLDAAYSDDTLAQARQFYAFARTYLGFYFRSDWK